MYKIPFNKPSIAGNELKYIKQAIKSGHISGDGYFTKKCHDFIEKRYGAKKALLTTSGTAALEMAAILCDIKPGDEVIMPSFTFVSTANAFVLRGATPKFIDIREDTLNIDENLIEKEVNEKTKAILVVHYAGVSCEMDRIMEVAKKYAIFVIEDAAQAIESKYKNKYLGTIGHFGCFSFHETKNVNCGEGGALLINDENYIERAEVIREKGTNRSKFFRGEVGKYNWVDIGSSYLPSEILAAFLFGQLEKIETITNDRLRSCEFYYSTLDILEKKKELRLPIIPEECQYNGHIFYIILENKKKRNELIDYLRSVGILSVFHYLPLHLSEYYKEIFKVKIFLKITEKISNRLLRLPLFFRITNKQKSKVVKETNNYFKLNK